MYIKICDIFENMIFKTLPDISPMAYCVFGLLKQALYKQHTKTLDGLWKLRSRNGTK